MTEQYRRRRWLTHKEVMEQLMVSTKTIKRRMDATPEEQAVWVAIGHHRRKTYRWKADQVDQWWIDINRSLARGLKTEATEVASR